MQIKTRMRMNTLVTTIVIILVLLSMGLFSLATTKSARKMELVNQMREIALAKVLLRDDFLLNHGVRAARQWSAQTEELRGLFARATTRFKEEEEDILLDAKDDFDATAAGFSAYIEAHSSKEHQARPDAGLSQSERRLVNQVYLKSYAMTDNISRLYDLLHHRDIVLRDMAVLVNCLLLLAGGILIIFNSTVTARLLTQRLATLRQGLANFGAGDLDLLTVMDGEDELAALALTSNEMAAQLQASYTSIDNLQKEIVEREQAQLALQVSEGELANLLEKLNRAQQIAVIGSWEWNLQTNQVWWSEETYRIFGVTPHDFVPSFAENNRFIHPEEVERYGRLFAHSLQTGEPLDDEFRLIAGDGGLKSINAKGQVLCDDAGQPLRFIGTVMDITARKQAEEERRLLSNFNKLILNSVTEGILGLDMEGRHTFANPAVLRMLGYEAEELIGQESHSLWHHTKADGTPCPKEICAINTAIREGTTQHIATELFWRKDGTSFPVECMCSPLLEQDRRAGTVLTFTDVTERRQAEEKMAAALEEKEMLLREIHHRVKNNMQIISSLLKLQANYIADEQAKEHFRECQQRIAAMAAVHTLLYKSQNFAAINFADYVRGMTSQLLQAYRTGPASIGLVIQMEEIMLPIDSAIPCGLLINELITNALKYAFPAARQGEISIEMQRTEEGIRLCFADNGIGLPPDRNLRATETFGLKLVQMLVKQLDGSMEQFSDQGTRYVIRFKPATTQERGHV